MQPALSGGPETPIAECPAVMAGSECEAAEAEERCAPAGPAAMSKLLMKGDKLISVSALPSSSPPPSLALLGFWQPPTQWEPRCRCISVVDKHGGFRPEVHGQCLWEGKMPPDLVCTR